MLEIDAAVLFFLFAFGAFLQGSAGFGFPFLVTPMAALIKPELIPGALMVVSLLISLDVAYRERKHIQHAQTGMISLGRLVGAAFGAYVIAILPLSGLKLLVATSVGLGVLVSITGFRPKISKPVLLIAGMVSGFMGTSTTIGGPPVAMIYQHRSGPEVRAVMSSVLFLGALISIFWLTLFGKFGLDDIWRALIYLPAVFLGLYLSRFGANWLDRGRMRVSILIMSSIASIVLIINALI